ncbi:MAG TPA: hypothetical protein VKB59_21065 [Micromonosporaceae bacterium]|nr:hypothetical protein [Micromonosporaceae bacterium]
MKTPKWIVKLSAAGAAAIVAGMLLAMSPTVASAQPASPALPAAAASEIVHDRTPCGPPQSPASGTAHAKIRNCVLDWYEDTTNGLNGVDLDFQLLDSATDGVCARAVVSSSAGTHTFSECNGVWVSKSVDIDGYVASIKITLSYGGTSPVAKTFADPFPHL